MREILFRGKDAYTGEWVHGFLVDFGNGDCWIISGFTSSDYSFIRVIPETVGQYTGLDDKNGVKIFEDDVVLGISTYKVVFVQGGFFLSDISTPNSNLQLLSDLVSFVALIGNIHDNPELMEDNTNDN